VTERAPNRHHQPAGQRRVVRLVDIARAVGVHPSTVSRVLNGEVGHSLRPETVERILTEARARRYRPNALARALRQHRTGAPTFVVPMLRNPIWVRLQRGALLRAAERGYVVMIMEEPTEDPKPPGAYSYLVTESRADGLLLATTLRSGRGRGSAKPDEALSAVPHVYVNRRGPEQGNDVVMDEAGAVRLFLDHVAGLGHRSVLLVDGRREVDTVYRRAAAIRRHCAALGLTAVIRHAEATEAGGFAVIRRLLATRPLPTAIGVGSIEQVFGVLAALRDARIAVPGAVSLVSLDEDESLAYLDVPVTSICMPLAELGAAAVDALIARIDGTGGSNVLIGEPMSLVSRGSVGPPPAEPGTAQPAPPGTAGRREPPAWNPNR
jgi:DNA-binding LacI/PurR family transcriptional regulator